MAEEDLERLGKSHYTSKLQVFEDLEKMKSLGFRGEALASLMALSNVSISSRPNHTHDDETHAVMMEFGPNGIILSRQHIAREVRFGDKDPLLMIDKICDSVLF
jgi:DNA mismatch repair ATPase MutL